MKPLDISNPFIVQFLSGTTHILQNRGIDLLVANASEPQLWQETYDRLIVSRKVDGFIVMRTESDDPRISYLLEKNVPFVAFGRTESAHNFAWLDVDCGGAAADAVRHLAALGHQRIGHITASRKVNFARLRHHAIKQAITELGWQYDPSLVVNAGLTAEDGQRASCQLMALERPPTALICDLDLLAFGAIAALRDLGLQAGRDVSVIGYGDVPFCRLAFAGAQHLFARCRNGWPVDRRDVACTGQRHGAGNSPAAAACNIRAARLGRSAGAWFESTPATARSVAVHLHCKKLIASGRKKP